MCCGKKLLIFSGILVYNKKETAVMKDILTIVDNVYRGFSYRCSDNRERTIKVNPLQRNSSSKKMLR